MNKYAKKYYKDIKAVIPPGGEQEKRLICDYKLRILELNETNPHITYDELQQSLGTPDNIVTTYYEGADTEYIMKRVRATHTVRFCVCCMLILSLSAFAVSAGVNMRLYQEIHHGIITHEKVMIE